MIAAIDPGLVDLVTALTGLVAAIAAVLARREIRQNVGTSASNTDGGRTVHEALELQDDRLETLEHEIVNGHTQEDG